MQIPLHGKRLQWARKRAKLSQPELSELSQVSQQLISKLENGNQKGSSYDPILARHLGVSAYWLSTGLGEPHDIFLTPSELKILNAYRASQPSERLALEAISNSILNKVDLAAGFN